MPLKHADIWRAIDRLAEQNGYSPSGLAKKAGLNSTAFNPSKRSSKSRKRWPSTESIAAILQATGASLDEFVALASDKDAVPRATLPMLGLAQARRAGVFDEDGHPAGSGWEDIRFVRPGDPHAFVLEISGKSMEPIYREGDRIVVSPSEKSRRGDRVVARTKKGEMLIRQLGRESAQKIELLALSPDGAAINLAAREIEWICRIVWVSQ